MRIAVIGGGGRMGSWFSRYFSQKGYSVIIADPIKDKGKLVAESLGTEFTTKNSEAVKDSDLALLAVPIFLTPSILDEVREKMKRGAALCEISSIKKYSYGKLGSLPATEIVSLCLHPLFGPGRKEAKGSKVAFIPVHDKGKELTMAKTFFPDFDFVTVDHVEHDKIMAFVLSLTHFANIVFLMTAIGEGMDRLERLGGSTFNLQRIVSTSVLHDSPELSASIQLENQNSVEFIEKFMKNAESLKDIVARKELNAYTNLYNDLKKKIGRNEEDMERIYVEANEFLDRIS